MFPCLKEMSDWGWKVSVQPITIVGRPWEYRGEGNANIVIALQDRREVVRLSKVGAGEGSGDLVRDRRKVEREVVFGNTVFVPLLGLEYGGRVKAVEMGWEEIQELNRALRPLRPHYRLHKELKVPFATAHSDFTRSRPLGPTPPTPHSDITSSSPLGPTPPTLDYCIEIKPKQGWWPKHLRNNPTPHQLCTYCLNQFLKLKRGKIGGRTRYCPLDLFSGIPSRIVRAVVALVSNPQNNLRIFRDGQLVYGENNKDSLQLILDEWIQNDEDSCRENPEPLNGLSSLIQLLCLALLKPKGSPEGIPEGKESYEKVKSEVEECVGKWEWGSYEEERGLGSCLDHSRPLPLGSLLSRILDIQKLADVSGGIGAIYSMYRKICPTHSGPLIPSLPKPLRPPRMGPMGGSSTGCDSSCSGDESGSELSELDSILEGDGELGRKSEPEWEEEDEDVTIRDERVVSEPCPSLACLSQERWLDEIEDLSVLSKPELSFLEGYLMAATAKDCSIMVTFSPLHTLSTLPNTNQPSSILKDYQNPDLTLKDINGKLHRVRIGVADLDPKPLTCIVKHFLRDEEMMEDYNQYLSLNAH